MRFWRNMMWKIVVFTVLASVFAVGLGGKLRRIHHVDINDEGVQDALNFAVEEHNRRSNNLYLSLVEEVVKAQSETVSGTTYFITVKMAKSTCRKDRAIEGCAIQEDPEKAKSYQCQFTVWIHQQMDDIRLEKEKCHK